MPEAGIRELHMRCLTISILAIAVAGSAQQQTSPNRAGMGATALSEGSNLPVEKIGNDDLVGITVYDAPELTRTVRVGSDGTIRLPMLRQHIPAACLPPKPFQSLRVAG